MRRFRNSFLLGGLLLAVASQLPAQLSDTAVRVLGQPDLRQNGLNSVDGSELFNPAGVAIDERGGEVRLYVADASNNRILAWRDVRSFQRGARADLFLAQRSFQHTVARGIGALGLNQPQAVTVDPATGDLYVSDTSDHRVLRFISPFDNPQRVEAEAVFGQLDFNTFGPNQGGLSSRTLRNPAGLDFDSEGNLWIVDTGNHRVLRYPAGLLNGPAPEADIVLGQPDFESAGANGGAGTPDEFSFNTPVDIAFHPDGSLYVADALNSRILVFDTPFETGQAATRVILQEDFNRRDVRPRINASEVRIPNAIDIDSAGNLYIVAQLENRVVVFPEIATTLTPEAVTVFGQLTLELDLPNVNTFPRASAQGLLQPADVRTDSAGNVYIVDAGNHRVLRFNPDQTLAAEVFGQEDFTLNGPNRITQSAVGASFGIVIDYGAEPFPIFISDTSNNRILGWRSSLRFSNGADADLVIGQADFTTAIANSDTGRGQSPTATSLASPRGMAITDQGDLYVADTANNRVLRFPRPFDQTGRIRADLVLGQSSFTSSISAAVSASSLNRPSDVELGPNGAIFVADTGNSRVLQYSANPANGAFAARVFGQLSFSDGSGPTQVSAQTLAGPEGLHVDEFGFLYIADTQSNRVLVFPLSAETPVTGASASTVIGQPAFDTFGSGRSSSRMNEPRAVTTDAEGLIYVSDTLNNRVLVFPALLFLPFNAAQADDVIGQPNFNGNNPNFNTPDGLATAQGLFRPVGLFMDRSQTLYVGDTLNSRVVHFLRPAVVVSAATFVTGIGVSPGSLVSLFGTGLADDIFAADQTPLPKELGSRIIEVNGSLIAPQLFINQNQANFQVPVATPTGAQSVSIRRADTDELIAGGTLLVSNANPGLFTFSQNGLGQVLAINENGTLNGPADPAPRGSIIQLFGTGQGATSPVVPDGEPAPTSPLALTLAIPKSTAADCVTMQPAVCAVVGSKIAEVVFSGLAPGFIGLWQLNVRIPEGQSVVTGPTVLMRVLINQRPSNTVSIAIQ